jgi:hypothetical protein
LGIQLDGATGKLLHIERRRSDIIEKKYDGSIVDDYFKTGNGFFKLFYIQPSWDLHFYYLQSQDSGSGMDLRG